MAQSLERGAESTQREQLLGQQLKKCLQTDLNPKTVSIYANCRDKFENWWKAGDWSKEWDVSLVRILYLTELIEQGKSSTVPSTVSALNYYFGRVTIDYEQMLKSVMSSAARKSAPVKHREKVEKRDYMVFISNVCDANLRVIVLGILLFRGMLRISEALALELNDVTYAGDKWTIRIAKSKTDQLSKGMVRAFVASTEEHKILTSWAARTKLRNFQFVFQAENGPARPINYNTANKLITERWIELGLQDKAYTTHAFRGGGASTALEEGALQSNVQRFGRWKSEKAFEAYVRDAVQIQANNAADM